LYNSSKYKHGSPPKNNTSSYPFLLSIIVLTSFISADKIVQTNPTGGITIYYPKLDYLPLDGSFNLHIHVENETSRLTNETTSCLVHIYNITNDHVVEKWMGFDDNKLEFEEDVNNNTFNKLGVYSWIIECNSSKQIGGASGIVTVTPFALSQTLETLYAHIFLIILIFYLISSLNLHYKNTNYKESTKKITESHDGNWSKTFIKTVGNNLMKNSFLWYYTLGWFIIFLLKNVVEIFMNSEIVTYFNLLMDIYSFGFFLVIVVWIGILMNHFKIITDLIEDINWGTNK